ncbi:exportin-7 [Caerostris extrusa]|uniref:Exportin-7 n=1 Tax=Caerostris extrusa TaxID=172846 RepID=A0AAV4W759_CAEEX|nr:exportin-7 [Caerostris extrusa]
MLKSALCGGYVNFGVFRWYGDVALDDVLNTFVKMLLSVPQSDLLHYPKLSQTYYVLLECLTQDHMNFLSSLEPQLFLYILSSISEGLSSTDTMVCAGCCAALDHIMLSTNLNIVIFEECRNQWSMSRPLLGLILLNEEYFNQLRQTIINSQLPEKQCVMAQWFDSLMEGIERNLHTKNRERFTQNLSVFRRDVNDSLKGPNVLNSSIYEVN